MYSDKTRDIILDRYCDGESATELEREFGISTSTIRIWYKESGRQRATAIEKAINYYNENKDNGVTFEITAEIFGIKVKRLKTRWNAFEEKRYKELGIPRPKTLRDQLFDIQMELSKPGLTEEKKEELRQSIRKIKTEMATGTIEEERGRAI